MFKNFSFTFYFEFAYLIILSCILCTSTFFGNEIVENQLGEKKREKKKQWI